MNQAKTKEEPKVQPTNSYHYFACTKLLK